MADIVDKLIWMDTNTLDVAVADLCVEARCEIERLRALVDALHADRQEAAWKEIRRG